MAPSAEAASPTAEAAPSTAQDAEARPTRASLGFAAAPVPGDFATAPGAELTSEDDSGSVVSADPSYIWDLAATDVFPAAPVPPAEGTPEAATADTVPPSPEDTPGDGGN